MTQFIEKSGTGIHRSGTGIHRSGTGIEKSGTGKPRLRRLAPQLVGLLALAIGFSSSLQASEPRMLLTQDDQGVRVSLHIDNTIVVGEIGLHASNAGYATLDLHDFRAIGPANGVQSYGSGTGSDRSKCGQSGVQSYGSGTGSVRGDCGTSGLQSYGSGTGSQRGQCGPSGLQTNGSGTGSADCGCGVSGTQSYGSGTGSYGSGTGSYGSGTGSYGSGTGNSKTCANSAVRWGKAELVFESDAIYVLIHRDSPDGEIEVLATVQSRAAAQTSEDNSTDSINHPVLTQR